MIYSRLSRVLTDAYAWGKVWACADYFEVLCGNGPATIAKDADACIIEIEISTGVP